MEGIKIELFIPAELKDEPVIYNMIKEFNIHMKILEASFSAESGWAIIIVDGERPEVERLFNHLREHGITIEFR